jgi:hypothetical protein
LAGAGGGESVEINGRHDFLFGRLVKSRPVGLLIPN